MKRSCGTDTGDRAARWVRCLFFSGGDLWPRHSFGQRREFAKERHGATGSVQARTYLSRAASACPCRSSVSFLSRSWVGRF